MVRMNPAITANTVASAAARNKTSNNGGGNRVINDVIGAVGNIAKGVFNEARGRSGGYTPQPKSPTQPKAPAVSRPKPQTSVNDIAKALVDTGKGIYNEVTNSYRRGNRNIPILKVQPLNPPEYKPYKPTIFGQEYSAMGPNKHRSIINPDYAAELQDSGYPFPAYNGEILDNPYSFQPTQPTQASPPVAQPPVETPPTTTTPPDYSKFVVPEIPVEDRTPLSEQSKQWVIWSLQNNGRFPAGFEYLITYPEYQPYLQYLR